MKKEYPTDSELLFAGDNGPMLFKVGDFVTDEKQVYVLGRDLEWHYCDSGNHAEYHVSHEELKRLVNGK